MPNTVGLVSNPGTGYTIVTHVLPPSHRTEQSVAPTGPLRKFLKGEPKALGTVQIMFGVVMLLFGIVITTFSADTLSVYSGITFWGALMNVTTGALSVAASNKLNRCLVKGSLVMNVLNAVTSAIAIILFSIDLAVFHRTDMSLYPNDDYREDQLSDNSSYPYGIITCGWDYGYASDFDYHLRDLPNGITGVLLVLSILQFFISISVSAFGCKAICNNEPLVNINVVPNTGGSCSVVNPFPAQNNEQWMYTASAASASSPPMESPPEYSPPETKGQMCY